MRGQGESLHSEGSFRVGSSAASVVRDAGPDRLLRGVGADPLPYRGTPVRDDLRGIARDRGGSESPRHAPTVAGAADTAGRSSRRHRFGVILFLFYLIVAAGYATLTMASRHTAEAVFPFVALLLLAPALYGEVLRVRRRR
jgi:hypothetical protein